MSALTILFDILLEETVNKANTEMDGTQTGKNEIKVSLFQDEMVVYIKKIPKESTKEPLKLVSLARSQIKGKTPTKKSIISLDVTNWKRKIKKQ